MLYFRLMALTCLTFGLSFAHAQADDYSITLQDHHFSPQTIEIPAKTKVQLTVINQQSTAAEFESDDLDREKVVKANSKIMVNLGPLEKGTYSYFDDFNHDTTGTIVVK